MPVELFTKTELARLGEMRARFLDGSNAGGGYWRDDADLALYDVSFGERIGWKWDTVIAELHGRGWKPQAKHVVDFGCGSGVAGRRVLGAWDGFESVTMADVSPVAMRFAEGRAKDVFPTVRVRSASPAERLPEGSLLVASHVVNELDEAGRARFIARIREASEVLWVESGTHADSRRLIAVREEVREGFDIVAPCTHSARCGMLTRENERHWCHHFAHVPGEISRDACWAQFGRELGIDLRALPCSFLVLQRRGPGRANDAGISRIIGRPREAKARMEVLSCSEGGVGELMLQKRDVPDLFKELRKGRAGPLYRWTCEGRRIVAAEPG